MGINLGGIGLLPESLGFKVVAEGLHASLVLLAAQLSVLIGLSEGTLGKRNLEPGFIEVADGLREFQLHLLIEVLAIEFSAVFSIISFRK